MEQITAWWDRLNTIMQMRDVNQEIAEKFAEILEINEALLTEYPAFESANVAEICETIRLQHELLRINLWQAHTHAWKERHVLMSMERKRRELAEERESPSAKRAAADLPSASSDTLPDGTSPTSADSAPPPAKKAKEGLEPKHQPKNLEPLYSLLPNPQPKVSEPFYNFLTKDFKYSKSRSQMKRSHVSRIQETDAGEDAPYTCSRCKYENEPCRVYKEESMNKYFHDPGTNNWRACGVCRHYGFSCDHVQDAVRTSPTEKELQFQAECEVSSKYLDKGLHMPADEVLRTEALQLRREKAEAALSVTQLG